MICTPGGVRTRGNAVTDLFAKYDVPAPRYTSYPTVPFWTDSPTTEQWIDELNKAFADEAATLSLYFHLPFCESLCTFCACNTVITRDHRREEGYVDLLSTEWGLYVDRVAALRERPLLGVHLGGGTPTFFSAENLEHILKPVLDSARVDRIASKPFLKFIPAKRHANSSGCFTVSASREFPSACRISVPKFRGLSIAINL